MSEFNNKDNRESFLKKLKEPPAPEEPVKTFTQRDWLKNKGHWDTQAFVERQKEIKGTKSVMRRTLAALETNRFYNIEELEFLFDIRKNEGLMESLTEALKKAAVKYEINDQGLKVEEFKPEFLEKAADEKNNRLKIGNRKKKSDPEIKGAEETESDDENLT